MITPTDVDERLRAAHARVPAPDAAAVARARARLDAAMADKAPRRRAPRWRLALAAATVVAVAGAAAVALLPTRVETPVAPATAEAARACFAAPSAGPPRRCLRALGDVAAAQQALAAGEVFYQSNLFTIATAYIDASGQSVPRPSDASYAVSRTVFEEIWLAPDGSGRIAYGSESAVHPAGPADRRAWRAAGSPDLDALMGAPGDWGPKVSDFRAGELDEVMLFNSNLEAVLPKRDPLSVLPREPRALEAFLHRAARTQRPEGPASSISNTFGTDVTTFLRYPRTPPDLRAALLDVFAKVPGARLLGKIGDSVGRPAAAIQLPRDMNDGNDIVAFDPATARLVAEGRSDGDGGVRWGRTYALRAASVARVGERP
jgi:hypothetical protein